MSQSSADVVRGLYDAFARADIPAILGALDENIDWRSPENLPHGGDFAGRDAVGRFFEGIGESWENLVVDVQEVISSGEQVVVLARAHGRVAERARTSATRPRTRGRWPTEYRSASPSTSTRHRRFQRRPRRRRNRSQRRIVAVGVVLICQSGGAQTPSTGQG
jgi:ketosteroid isomerase-like protein